MCAFLYDFAPRFFTEDKDELPGPAKAWPVVAGACSEHDYQWPADATVGGTSPWNGSVNIRRGDVLLVYCLHPHNSLCYVARALADGFADPFCDYYTVTWLGDVTPIPRVTFKELAVQPQLAESSVIKTRVQDPNSGSFTLAEYEAVLTLMAKRGQDVTRFP